VGDSLFAVRAFSVLVSLLALPVVARMVYRLVGPRVAWATALIVATAPLQVHYAQEARMYALLNLLVALAFLAVAELLTADSPGGAGRRRWWALLVVAQSAALWTHNTTTVLLVVTLNVGVCGAAWWSRRTPALGLPGFRRPHFWRAWWLSQVAVLLLWLPWSGVFVAQARAVDADFWIAPLSPARILAVVQALTVAHVPRWWPLSGWWGLIGVILALWGLLRLHRPQGWLVGMAWLLPLLLLLLVSLRRPLLQEHALLWTILPYAMLLAYGLTGVAEWCTRRCTRGRSGWAALLLVVGIGLYQGGGLYGYFAEFAKEPWDRAAAYVAARAQPGDLVLFHATWAELTFDAYYPAAGPELVRVGVPVHLFDGGQIEPKMTAADVPRLWAALAGASRVWLVYTHGWYTDPQGLLPAALEDFGRVVDSATWPGIEVWLIEAE
jgi:4-amino-4-deoxy-L-arabinose transferase-like glycosyltransferase